MTARLIPNGQLLASTDPTAYMMALAAEITALRQRVERADAEVTRLQHAIEDAQQIHEGVCETLRERTESAEALATDAATDRARLIRALETLDQGLQDAGSDPYVRGETSARDLIGDALAKWRTAP